MRSDFVKKNTYLRTVLKIIIFFVILSFFKSSISYSKDRDYINDHILTLNFKFFKEALDKKTGFPYDHIYIADSGEFTIGRYTSPTIIGLWAVLLTDIIKEHVSFPEFGIEEAKYWLTKLLLNLERVPKWEGLFYWYDLEDKLQIAEDELISLYDNGNLTASLMVVYGAFCSSLNKVEANIARKAHRLLSDQLQGWRKVYDEKRGLLCGTYKKGKPQSNIWLDRFYTESRIAVLVAIILADVPQDAWFNIFKGSNCPKARYILNCGDSRVIFKPYQGAFQAWLPLLFIPEMDLSPQALKIAHENYALIQIEHAENTKTPFLRSAAANPDMADEYVYEPCIGIFNASEDWVRSDIGAPYATALMFPIYPEETVLLFQKAEKLFPQIIGPLGLYDSISQDGRVAKVYLALDQLQLLLAFFWNINQEYFVNAVEKMGKRKVLENLYNAISL